MVFGGQKKNYGKGSLGQRIVTTVLLLFTILLYCTPGHSASLIDIDLDLQGLQSQTASLVTSSDLKDALLERIIAARSYVEDANLSFQQSDKKGTRKHLKDAKRALLGFRKVERVAESRNRLSSEIAEQLDSNANDILLKIKLFKQERLGSNSPPVANAGIDQTVAYGVQVTLDGSGSFDPEGQELTYSWVLLDPNGSVVTLSNPLIVNPIFVAELAGTYSATLTVSDGTFSSDPDEVLISTVNSAPVANAGPDKSAAVGANVVLDGSNSFDIDGDPLSYSWLLKQVPNGSTSTITGEYTAKPTITLDKPGEYLAELTVSDGALNSQPDTAKISTINSPPIADAGPDQSVPLLSTVYLDGSGSTDVDGDPLQFAWSILSKPTNSSAFLSDMHAVNPSITLDTSGEYLFQLIVNDGVTESNPDTVQLVTSNTRPLADSGKDQTAYVGTTVLLDGTASSDADGDTLTFQWSLISAPVGSSTTIGSVNSSTTSLAIDLPGTYQVQLIVNDGVLNSEPSIVLISTTNSAPVADAGPDTAAILGQNITLDGSASSDADYDPLSYNWSLIVLPDESNATILDPDTQVTSFTPDKVGTYVAQLIVNDGEFDSAPDTALITIEVQSNQPPVINSLPVVTAQVNKLYQYQVTALDPEGAPVTYGLQSQISGMSINTTGLVTWVPSAEGLYSVIVSASDPAGITATQSFEITVSSGDGTPPNPEWIATEFNESDVPTFGESVSFIYSGDNPVQTGVEEGAIVAQRAVVLRGQVLDKSNNPIPLVKISVKDHTELGSTLSRSDGMFDLVANGGGSTVVEYSKDGYLPVHRTIDLPWRDYVVLEDVVMTELDQAVTTIDVTGSSSVPQVMQGSQSNDADGARQATIIFPSQTTATMTLPGGGTQVLSSINVRATEYTVGPNGPKAMPAELPAASGYTYAVELSSDEAIAANATRINFNTNLPVYVDNFLNFPVGSIVPSGWYDRGKGAWIPSANGQIIKILSVTNNIADIDTNGDGLVDNSTELAAIGITIEEQEQLAQTYSSGKVLWRVPVSHFTPWDFNYPYGPEGEAIDPVEEPPETVDEVEDAPELPCEKSGCVIQAETQVLGEKVEIAGTPYTLHYSSERVPGKLSGNIVKIPLSGESLPASLKAIELVVKVAGQRFEKRFTPLPNLTYEYTWDGRDVYGRVVKDEANLSISVNYIYNMVYYAAREDFTRSFGVTSQIAGSGGGTLTTIGLRDTQEVKLARQWTLGIGGSKYDYARLGGWTIDVQHGLLPISETLLLGNGSKKILDFTGGDIQTVIGQGGSRFNYFPSPIEDGVNPLDVVFFYGRGIDIGTDGTVYIADDHRIVSVTPEGYVSSRFVDANEHRNFTAFQIAVDKNGVIYGVTWGSHSVKKLNPDGSIELVAGSDDYLQYGFSGDGGPATEALLRLPADVDIASDGTIYIADSNNYAVRKIAPDGIISTVYKGDAYIFSVAVGNDGDIYFTEHGYQPRKTRLYRIDKTGKLENIVAVETISDGLRITDLTVAKDGTVYFGDGFGKKVYAYRNGTLQVIAGGGENMGDKILATDAQLARYYNDSGREFSGYWNNEEFYLAEGLDGNLLVVSMYEGTVRAIDNPLQETIPSADGSQLFVFESGRHTKTVDTITGAELYTFGYDSEGQLTSITDVDGNTTTIDRSDPTNIRIISPYGQETTLSINNEGYATQIQGPGSITHTMGYTTDGLLTSYTNPNHYTFTYEYDALGRLIKDNAPNGGGWTITSNTEASGKEVTLESGEGRKSIYHSERKQDGSFYRKITNPDGTFVESLGTPNGQTTITYPSGEKITRKEGGDPRFGTQALVLESTAIELPSGIISNQTISRSVTLADPKDPLSIENVSETTTTNGRTSIKRYDATTKIWEYTSAEGRKWYNKLNDQGKLSESWIDGITAKTYFEYDPNGRLQKITRSDGTETRDIQIEYYSDLSHQNGLIKSITDEELNRTAFVYDPGTRVSQQLRPDLTEIGFTFDNDGNLIELDPPEKPIHSFIINSVDKLENYIPPVVPGVTIPTTGYEYNLDKQTTSINRPGQSATSYVYDSVSGKLTTVTTGRGAFPYSYDPVTGFLTQIKTPENNGLDFLYDGDLLTQTTWSGEILGSVRHAYSNDLVTSAQEINGSNRVEFLYDQDLLLTNAGDMSMSRNSQNGLLEGSALGLVKTSYGYNNFGEIDTFSATSNGSVILEDGYLHDHMGRIVQKSETLNGTTTTYGYIYDELSRLISVKENGLTIATYGYDTNGNRTHLDGNLIAVYDDQDRLNTYGAKAYVYTPNGELDTITDGTEITDLDYDSFGNLLKVTLPNGQAIEYIVDGKNRRIGKKVDGTLVQGFLYQDQLNPVAELDGSGNILSRFVYGEKTNVPAYIIKGGNTYRIVSDHLGSPRLVVNVSDGSIIQRIDYDPWGNVTTDTNPGFQPFGFAGGIYDQHTKLVKYGYRDYDPITGRWLSKDPIRFKSGDTNNYSYVLNDPVNNIDASGLICVTCQGIQPKNYVDGRKWCTYRCNGKDIVAPGSVLDSQMCIGQNGGDQFTQVPWFEEFEIDTESSWDNFWHPEFVNEIKKKFGNGNQ